MRAKDLSGLSSDRLAEIFANIAFEQGEAAIDGQSAKYNRLYDRKKAIEDELQSRPGDQRRVLATLYDHPNIYVRYMAAKATLAVEPDAARAVLRKIADSNQYPAAAEARGTLNWLADGRFVPE